MTDFEIALKAEIAKLAKKELRAALEPFKKASALAKSRVTAIGKKAAELDKRVKQLEKLLAKGGIRQEAAEEAPSKALRFSPAAFAALRKRLGLTAEEMGRLVGASAQSAYRWEKGDGKPRRKSLILIDKLKGMGKREVAALLAET